MNGYRTMKSKHQEEINGFPFFFAFSTEQFNEGMEKFGLRPEETDKIYRLGSTGGFYLKTDSDRLREMFDRHNKEIADAIANDADGRGFVYEMFYCALADHEYSYTGDISDALAALGLTADKLSGDEKLLRGIKKAMDEQSKNEIWE